VTVSIVTTRHLTVKIKKQEVISLFGDKLKKLRTDNNLTQDELAEKIMVTRTAISKWETNRGYPSIDSLKELSKLFDISIDELIQDSDVENKRQLEIAKNRKFYWVAMLFFAIAVITVLFATAGGLPYMMPASVISVVLYIVFAQIFRQKSKNLKNKK
jgi:transcriptional regulator with XRE-family HTH domain